MSSRRLLKYQLALEATFLCLSFSRVRWPGTAAVDLQHVLVTFPMLYAVRGLDSWGCSVLCHFASCMPVSTNKAACFILKLNDFADVSEVALSIFNEKNYLQSSVKFKA